MVAITINKLVAMGVAFLATSAIAAPLEDTAPGGLVEVCSHLPPRHHELNRTLTET